MGTACARWLAEAGHSVALVGPDEPEVRLDWNRPFASHHDAGRITRAVSHDPVWSALSRASIARYRELEARSGVAFFHEVGAMMAGRYSPEMSTFTQGFDRIATELGAERPSVSEVQTRFGFSLPKDAVVSFEDTGAGWIDPRELRQAEEVLAERAGAEVFCRTVINVNGRALRLVPRGTSEAEAGDATKAADTRARPSKIASDPTDTLFARQVVVATGGYAFTDGLLPRKPRMEVYARTIAFAEVAGPIPEMPTLIWVPEDVEDDLYMLPPIRYPDGRWLMKIGGEIDSPLLRTNAEMTDWFQGDGRPEAGERLLGHLRRLLPDVPWLGTHFEPCAVSFTATGYPYIARIDDQLTLLTGGNGAGAKCCDELGRLGAIVAQGGDAPGFEAIFAE